MAPALPFDLKGRRAIVSGGLGRIGRAASATLARCGARVIVLDTAEHAWPAAEVEFAGAGLEIGFRRGDVAALSALPALVAECDAAAGGIDVWVNCAYPAGPDWPDDMETATPQSWSVNVEKQMTSACILAGEAAKCMATRRRGSIVNVASIYGVVSPDFTVYDDVDFSTPPAYAAIKGGIVAFSRYLAGYWGSKGVRVNAVCPGGVFAHQPDAFVAAYVKRTPLRRMATPEDIAGPIAFLASDAAAYVTGATLMVDGGWTAL